MHQCEYCGEGRCVKRACIDALLSNVAYYNAEISYRNAIAEVDKEVAQLKAREEMMRDLAVRTKQRLPGKSQP